MPKSIISNLTGRMRNLKSSLGPKTDSQSSPQHLISPTFRLFNRAKTSNHSSIPTSSRFLGYAGITSAALLAALPALLTLAPIFSSKEANAEPQTIGAAATIVPNLSLSAQNVSMVMTPTGSGSIFKTGSIDATVSTNNETGYTVYFSDKDDNTSLSHSNLANTAIASTASSLTGTNMLANTWGYTLSTPATEGADEVNNTTNLGLTYNSIPTDYTAIKTRSTQTTPSETSKLTFGVKIDNSIPSGTYSDEILISAIINYSSAGYDQNQLWLNKDGTRITTLQEMTPDVCASVPTPTVTATGSNVPEITLTDTRDNKTYQIKKLADGNCWMTSDLALGSTTEDIVLTSEKSNVATNFTLHKAKTAVNQTANSYDTGYTFTGNSTNNNTYLYNWYAATAGSGTQSVTSGNVSQDICPKGWHLPDNSGDMSWNKLLRDGEGVYQIATKKDVNGATGSNRYTDATVAWGSYNSLKTTSDNPATANNPLGLHTTGYFYDGSLHYAATNSYYWTRTAGSDTSAHDLFFDINSVYPQGSDGKQGGRAIRCVADDKEYMQNWTGCAGLSEGEVATLTDRRDSKEYTVTKINHSDSDSLCWMTKNLALGGDEEMTLSKDLTDSSSDYILPGSSTSGFSDNTAENVYVHDTYGGYYTWKAATAGSTENTNNTNATKSICPKGWRLPTKAEFGTLKSYKGWSDSSGWTSGIFKGQLAGYYDYSSSPVNISSYGYYWSSTAYSSDGAYNLVYASSGANTDFSVKRYGRSVRCVSRS